MEKAASFLSSLLAGAGGHGNVRPRVPHQVLQRHLRAPGPHHRHWVPVGSAVDARQLQGARLHPEGGAQARAHPGGVAAGGLRRGLAAHARGPHGYGVAAQFLSSLILFMNPPQDNSYRCQSSWNGTIEDPSCFRMRHNL